MGPKYPSELESAKGRRPLSAVDAVDRAQLIRLAFLLGVPIFPLLSLAEGFLLFEERIGRAFFVLLLLIFNPSAIAAGVWLIWRTTHAAATGFSTMILAAGNLRPAPSFSREESLVARGRYQEAAESYRSLIAADSASLEARLRLADLLRTHLADQPEAERLYLEVRSMNPDRRQELIVFNTLIDLYRAQGRSDRMLVEVARLASRFEGTRAGSQAARALKRLKEENAAEQ